MEYDDEVTPITNGKHAPSADAIRITNIALVFSALSENFRELGATVDSLSELEKRDLEIQIAKQLDASQASLAILKGELLNPNAKS